MNELMIYAGKCRAAIGFAGYDKEITKDFRKSKVYVFLPRILKMVAIFIKLSLNSPDIICIHSIDQKRKESYFSLFEMRIKLSRGCVEENVF